MSRQWYRIDIVDGLASKDYFGTSDLAPEALVQHVTAGGYVMLGDLCYNSGKGGIVPASTQVPQFGSTVYINPAKIVSILPLTGDPRNGSATAP